MSKIYSGCLHPLKAFPIGLTDNGKIKYKIKDYKINHLEFCSNGSWRAVEAPFKIYKDCTDYVSEFVELPCGSCVNCKLNRARQWAQRCVAESFLHQNNYFLTLTYDDENLPENGNLVKEDLQKFWKRLRDYNSRGLPFLDENFKYFACGEYGTSTFRPHYHALCFGLNLISDDLRPYKIHHGHHLFNSSLLDSIWQKGFVVVGAVSESSCNYVSRYTYKKTMNEMRDFYHETGLSKEFTVMSRRPGIASEWIEINWQDLYREGYLCYATEDGGRRLYPTKYYTNKLEALDPELFQDVKDKGKAYMLNKKEILFKNDNRPYLEILKDQETIRLAQTKRLLERNDFDA